MENVATTQRITKDPLKKTLQEVLKQEADQFDFHALVKVVEQLNYNTSALGESDDPSKEAIALKTKVGFDFPTSDITFLETTQKSQVEITTAFFNIAGIQGPLPIPYVQLMIDRERQKDAAFHAFLDIFNHRLISLLHRIRKKYWIGVASDPPEKTCMGYILRCFLGLGSVKKDLRLKTLDRSLLFYAGLIWHKTRSVIGLEKLLSHYFNLPVYIDQFQAGWISIPKDQQTKIGHQGSFHQLGKDSVLGDRFWEQQDSIKIHIGPMNIKDYINFLKPGKAYRELKTLVAYYCGEFQIFQLNPILKKEDLPMVRLGKGIAVHWTSWINHHVKREKDDQQNIMTHQSFKII